MKLTGLAVTSIAAPSLGPAMITFAGFDVPVLAMATSVIGLLLARVVAPPPLRKLTRLQEVALTALLVIVLFLLVIGQFSPSGEVMEPGIAGAWGIGLGFSGLLAIEFFGARVMAMLRIMFGRDEK